MGRTSLVVVLAAALVGCGTSVSGGGTGGSGSGGGGDAGGSPSDPVTDGSTSATTGGDGTGGGGADGDGDAYPLDCRAYSRCGVPQDGEPGTECPEGTGCTAYPGCLTPICIADEEACDAHCGTSEFCEVLHSYPGELELCSAEVPGVDELTCDDVQAELDVIQACTSDDQCGRVLPGTSCGCTRDLVARNDVPVDVFEAMLAAVPECGFGSTCDCPEADGFACVDGRCAWNYVDGP